MTFISHRAFKITAFYIFSILLFLSFSFGVSVAKTLEEASWPQSESDLPADPQAVFGELPNGFRYVLIQNREPRDRVSMHLNVQAGSMHESEEQQGLAHYLEHMLFKGTTHFPPGTMVNYFQSIGMRFGPDANAHTGLYKTVYDILLPDGSEKQLQKALTVMSDWAQGALLLPLEIEKERGVILAEKQTRDSASYRIFEKTFSFELNNTRLSQRLPIGIESVLKKAGQKELKDYYDAWYRPEKLILVVVGDFEPEVLPLLIEETFGSMSPRAPPLSEPEQGIIRHEGNKAFYAYEKETGNTKVVLKVVQTISSQPDTLDRRKKAIWNRLGMQIFENRLTKLLSDPETPFTSVSVESGRYFKTLQQTSITAECAPEKWEATLSLLTEKLKQAIEYGFLPEELIRAQKDEIITLRTASKMASTRKSQTISTDVISALNNRKVWMAPGDKEKLFVPIVEKMTLREVSTSFKNAWKSSHRLIIVTGNVQMPVETSTSKILQVYEDALKKSASKPESMKEIVFPYYAIPESGMIFSRKEIKELGITQIQFQNGVKLNLKPTDFKKDSVEAILYFGSGRKSEPIDKPGISVLTQLVVNESGVGPFTQDALQRALAGRMASVSLDISEEQSAFVGRSTKEDIELLLQLFYAYFKDPIMQETAYSLSQTRYAQRYAELLQSPDGMFDIQGKQFFANGDSRFGLPDVKSFQKLTLSDIANWYLPQVQNGDIEISLVGDFDLEKTISLVNRYFGGLSERIQAESLIKRQDVKFAQRVIKNISVNSKIPKALVAMAYPTVDSWDIFKVRRLSLLAEVISDQLRVEIREKLGITYSSYAVHRPSRAYIDFGYLIMIASVAPHQTQKTISAIKEVVKKTVAKGVSDDQFQRAIVPRMAALKDAQRTNKYWLNVLNLSSVYPEQIEWAKHLLSDYVSITPKELTLLAKMYLGSPSKSAILTISTKPEE